MIKNLTPAEWDRLDEPAQREHLWALAERLNIDLSEADVVEDQLETIYEASATEQDVLVHLWAEHVLSASRWCPRRRLVGRWEAGATYPRWHDCGTRACERCSSWVADALAERYAHAFGALVDDLGELHVIEVRGKREVHAALQRCLKAQAAALRIPLGDDRAVVVTTLDVGTARTLADEGTTAVDALFNLLLAVPTGARVKGNKYLTQAVTASEQVPTSDIASDAPVVLFTKAMRHELVKLGCVVETTESGLELDVSAEAFELVDTIRTEGHSSMNPIPRRKAA